MIIDIKAPPPPYTALPTGPTATLSTLPAHVLLRIVYQTLLPDSRRTLYWLVHSLRCVNRTLYTASMHVLRSAHLRAYATLVRAPYSSDPFPASQGPVQRETAVLDRFIGLKVREDVWADDSELHLERDEGYRDLFDHAQPRARLEDLVRDYGLQCGLVSAAPTSRGPSPGPATPVPPRPSFLSPSRGPASPVPTPASVSRSPLCIANLSVTLAPRSAGLVLAGPTSRRTIASTPRTTDEPLEHVARRLLCALESE
ncbi:hypothetical protein C0992_003395 [Termitomyces sp. T32_za158]|nr:hypothetical protein C0992_003395 [Termitomyces sp. T32_za158]